MDAAVCVLMIIAAWAFVTGTGPILRVGGVKIQATSELRLTLWAAALFVVRHLAFRRPSLWQRLKRSGNVFQRWTRGEDPLTRGDGRAASPVTRFEIAIVTAVMIVLTLALSYPQFRQLDGVTDLGDPVFSIWRLAWIAHQLPRDPLRLFDANIFYPARVTLAYSDSLLLPGLAAAPFMWLGVTPTATHALFLLTSFVLAGVCMYLFVRSTTGQAPAALVAGVAFAFYPYRFDQYCHFEQLFSFWMPLALWALHRTMSRGRLIDGLLTGATVAAQYLSGMYLGAFFVVYVVPVWALLASGTRRARASLKPLLAGAGLALILVAPVAVPHLQARRAVGERPPSEVEFYSARPADYLVARADRVAYATSFGRGPHEAERDLFPGILVVILAAIALWPPTAVSRVAYAAGLLFAFDASLGTHGHVFPFLYWTFVPFRAFRVPPRFSMLVGLSLVVLAGYGVARLTSRIPRPALRWLLAAGLVGGFVVESWSTRHLEQVWPQPPAIYQWFRGRPAGVVAELPPAANEGRLYDPESRYMYFSTFHWQRLLNGYSGAFPESYLAFRRVMATFPDDNSVAFLRHQGADYIVLHEDLYGRERYRDVVNAMSRRTDLFEVMRAVSAGYEARIYRIAK